MSNGPDTQSATPRWVKMFAVAATLIGVLLVALVVTGIGGPHGPGRHLSPAKVDAGGAASEQK